MKIYLITMLGLTLFSFQTCENKNQGAHPIEKMEDVKPKSMLEILQSKNILNTIDTNQTSQEKSHPLLEDFAYIHEKVYSENIQFSTLPSHEEMFHKFFRCFKNTSTTSGYYNISRDTFYTSFDTVVNVNFNQESYKLIFFRGGYAGTSFMSNKKLVKFDSHATWGIVSVIRMKKNSKGWNFEEFVQDCSCGTEPYGETKLPKVINLKNLHLFLEHKILDGGQGYWEEKLIICNFLNLNQRKIIPISESDSDAFGTPTTEWNAQYSYFLKSDGTPYIQLNAKGFDQKGPVQKLQHFELKFSNLDNRY